MRLRLSGTLLITVVGVDDIIEDGGGTIRGVVP